MRKWSLATWAMLVAAAAVLIAAWMFRYETTERIGIVWDRWSHDFCTVGSGQSGKLIHCFGDM
ncbi:hypothetical protein HDG33_006595 [Paraburkholderia sp. Cpub6]|nr:hypothetical protein [Paraburkholderia sp. Cpub6]